MRVTIKIRHRHEPAPALIEKSGPDEVRATFEHPQRAITPGQAAVFYEFLAYYSTLFLLF